MTDTHKIDTPKIEMRDVRKSFGPKHVLRGVGFDIARPCTVVDHRTFVAARRDRHDDLFRAGFSVRTIR